jgi:LasA protease
VHIAALLLTLVLTPPVEPALDDAVAAAVPTREESTGTQVNVLRQEPAGWAFGSAVRLAPAEPDAYPDGWLWLARRSESGRWRVAMEGSPEFAGLSGRAPVLNVAERTAFAGLTGDRAEREQAVDYRTGMRLPYAVGQKWTYTGGPHQMSGGARSSIDLAGGDGKVRAARAGRAYHMCGSGNGWLRVVHDRGFATDYYHLRGTISADGRKVKEGQFLGYIGNDVSCGGSTTGPHVHFSLRRGGEYVAIDRYGIGKWSIRAGAGAYEGSAYHGSRRVGVGGALHNYGALGFREAVVDTNGGGVLNRRAGPGTRHKVVGTVKDGATVRVRCSAPGTTHTGRGGYRSNLWNRLSDGSWVSDVFLWTGTSNPVGGWC